MKPLSLLPIPVVLAAALSIPAHAKADDDPILISNLLARTDNSLNTTACFSFKNTGAQAATAIRFSILGTDGFHEATIKATFDRLGTFSPGILIQGPDNWAEADAGIKEANGDSTPNWGRNERERIKNCVSSLGIGRTATVNVTAIRVEYADGTEWRASTSTR